MAFDVTPTSGEGPYVFTADFTSKESFGHGYSLVFNVSNPSASNCPAPAGVTVAVASGAPALLLSGSPYVRANNPVPDGSCATYVLRIYDELGEQVDMKFVQVDNMP